MNRVKTYKFILKELFKFKMFCYHESTNSSIILWVSIYLFLLVINSISCMTVKPLHRSNNSYSCEYFEEEYVNISEIDKNIRRYNPEISKTVYLLPNYGSPIKTLKVYKYINNNEIERILLFHFSDKYNYELLLDTLIIEGSETQIKKKIYDDASVIVGDVQDLIFYIKLFKKEYDEIKNIIDILFKIHDMTLELDPNCKNAVLF